MRQNYRMRRIVAVVVVMLGIAAAIIPHPSMWEAEVPKTGLSQGVAGDAARVLNELEIKGRAPKTGYARSQFGDGWLLKDGCDMRNIILARDLKDAVITDCKVQSGVLYDPYTAKTITFQRGASTSDDVQIDHVVALSDAWQKGAQALTPEERKQFANDPLELLAVEGAANQQKGDGDAASWLPANKGFRCQYVARQIAIKKKYSLWVTAAEKDAMLGVLSACPGQMLPGE